jgi:hypothetical protein
MQVYFSFMYIFLHNILHFKQQFKILWIMGILIHIRIEFPSFPLRLVPIKGAEPEKFSKWIKMIGHRSLNKVFIQTVFSQYSNLNLNQTILLLAYCIVVTRTGQAAHVCISPNDFLLVRIKHGMGICCNRVLNEFFLVMWICVCVALSDLIKAIRRLPLRAWIHVLVLIRAQRVCWNNLKSYIFTLYSLRSPFPPCHVYFPHNSKHTLQNTMARKTQDSFHSCSLQFTTQVDSR